MAIGRKRQQVLLAVLLVVLAVVGYRALTGPSVVPLPTSNGLGSPVARRSAAATPAAPDVRLDALDAERPSPGAARRDLFRFKPKAPPPAPTSAAPAVTGPAAPPPAPAGPPPPPPIPYKFVGLVTPEAQPAKRIAVLSDGRNPPVYGREGDIIEGRFRILKIGVESIEMEYIDGRGRQTIRLSGS
jgi:hypothetical protein